MLSIFGKAMHSKWLHKAPETPISQVAGNNLAMPVVVPRLKAQTIENQITEVEIGITVLTKMTVLGRPAFSAFHDAERHG